MTKYCPLCGEPQRLRRSTPELTMKGVVLVDGKRGKRYRAQLWFNGTNNCVGTYASEKEAHEAYLKARDASLLKGVFTKE